MDRRRVLGMVGMLALAAVIGALGAGKRWRPRRTAAVVISAAFLRGRLR